MELKEKVKSLAKELHQQTINIRRHLHRHPELSFQEHKTAAFISKRLKEMGLEPKENVAGTGVTAIIKGNGDNEKVIALRADMDALPITEANEVSYKSKNEGVMHACGHDVHTASLLGAASILQSVKNDLKGSVKLVFQPGEERIPGGASLMIKDGVLQNPRPNSIVGQHVMPFLPVGTVGFREGMYMASADEIYMTVKGKGGHAAMPENLVDPVLIASHIIVALQQIVSRNSSPKIPSVLSFGKIKADGATNVIPDTVYIEGTFRTLNEEWRAKAKEQMANIVHGIAKGMGGEVDLDIKHGYPYLVNEPTLTNKLKNAAIDYMGKENVIDLDIWMAAEDFAFYSHEVDACFYRLGTRNEEKGITSGVHTPTFNIDEDALQTGAGLLAWLAISELMAT